MSTTLDGAAMACTSQVRAENLDSLVQFGALPTASYEPRSPGFIRVKPEDFQVEERLSFEPTDVGEHLLLQIRKVNRTTREVQKQLASQFRVPLHSVGYAGLKDKRSVATQWFSVHLPRGSSRVSDLALDVLRCHRHVRKVRPSSSFRNRFDIVVRQIDRPLVSFKRLQRVPNYFGEQRFGRDGLNVVDAMKWIQAGRLPRSRFLRSIYISALRSYAFNLTLAARVERGQWHDTMEGDIVVDGKPTGPLWGRGRSATSGFAREIEVSALRESTAITDALEWVGLKQERRAFQLDPIELVCAIEGQAARLSFTLPAGCYATSVLRECFDYRQAPD